MKTYRQMKQIMRYCRCYVHSIGKIVCRIYQSKVRVWMDILKIINRRYTQLCLISRVSVPRRHEHIFFFKELIAISWLKKTVIITIKVSTFFWSLHYYSETRKNVFSAMLFPMCPWLNLSYSVFSIQSSLACLTCGISSSLNTGSCSHWFIFLPL